MSSLREAVNGGDRVVVIAEAGVNHNGDPAIAHELIEVARASGADFVKFQTFDPSKLVAPNTEATPYQRERGAKSQSDLLAALALPEKVWIELRDHAEDVGIGFLSTPFDLDSARLLASLGVHAMKVSSGELTNLPYLRELAAMGIDLLVSTGMGTEAEVLAAADACSAAPFLAMFHCVSAYPAPVEQCNLQAIPVLAAKTGVPVGWSDHTPGAESALVAAALGARLFEKHFTMDRAMEGPDHAASLEPEELRSYVAQLKAVPAMLGDGVKRRMPAEEENAPLVRRSWHAARPLRAGEIVSVGDLVALRPEDGISPSIDIVGRTLQGDVAPGSAVRAADLVGEV
ncbi:N-acetylneuraminate synthase family protein [Microbacterium sediminis]|uniref:N-acetylneuraminate synthase n=1 Tax=Microbacterium sediminis TaxID=904291 RepID=A0A1B9NDN7_9MICO|nr:N-acetylneuraminate synthase family protein [Microbacterium sediminis]OCG74683.1 N-acetylneuraminate synthase [Microbacterium sediminis]QBR74980.1 N-acetylneuraminate synthase [Microbacterium sediminis]